MRNLTNAGNVRDPTTCRWTLLQSTEIDRFGWKVREQQPLTLRRPGFHTKLLNYHRFVPDLGHTPSTAGTFRKKFQASRAFPEFSPPQYGWGRLFFQKWFRRGLLRAGHGIPSSTGGISEVRVQKCQSICRGRGESEH